MDAPVQKRAEAAADREHVLKVVEGHLRDTVEDLEGKELDPSKSLADLGAASLDIVEVVSCSMRDLRIKVPRAELGKLKNMNDLVDLLHQNVLARGEPTRQ